MEGTVTNLQLQIDELKERVDLVALNVSKVHLVLHYNTGEPAANLTINGVNDLDGNPVVTSVLGVADGYFSGVGTHTMTIDYLDVTWSKTVSVSNGNLYKYEETVNKSRAVTLTTTRTIRFSPNISSIDFLLVGGGSGGASGFADWAVSSSVSSGQKGQYLMAGNGGKSGNYTVRENYAITPNSDYQITIGSGGAGGSSQMDLKSDSLDYTKCASKAGGTTNAFGLGVGGGASVNYSTTARNPGSGAYAFLNIYNENHTLKANEAPVKSEDAVTSLGIKHSGTGGGGGMMAVLAYVNIPNTPGSTGAYYGNGGSPSGSFTGSGTSTNGSHFIKTAYPGTGQSGARGSGGGGGGVVAYSHSYLWCRCGAGGAGGSGFVHIVMHDSVA